MKAIKWIVPGIVFIFVALFTGCRDLLKNPLLDKDSGESMTLLLIDPNFVKTKIAVRLVDNNTLEDINMEPVEVRFTGTDAANLITFLGKKQTTFTTSSSFVEVGYDPNITVNRNSPVGLTVIAISQHYISAPQFVSFSEEGVKNLVIRMISKCSGKTFVSGPFSEPFSLTYNGGLFSPDLRFLGDISSLSTGTDYQYLNAYMVANQGALVCNYLTDQFLYADYGVYYYRASGEFTLAPPVHPTKEVGLLSGDFIFSTTLRSGQAKCQDGLIIHLDRPQGRSGSGLFDYRLTFSNGQTKSGQISGTFPIDYLVTPIYYPAANPAVTVTVFEDSQYDISSAVPLSSACQATASFLTTTKANLETYKFVTQYSCPYSPLGMSLTTNGGFRKVGSTGSWTSFSFVEGVCVLQLEHHVDYSFRVNIDSRFYYYTLPTDPDRIEKYMTENQSPDYRLRSLSVTANDEEVVVSVNVEFNNEICGFLK